MKPDCIDHQRIGDRQGYGRRKNVGGKHEFLHRLKYCAVHGLKIEEIAGKVVRHSCDNPRCINPDHLLIGTVADNNRDKSMRGRHPDAKLTEAQVLEIRCFCKPTGAGCKTPNHLGYAAFAEKFGVTSGTVRSAYLGFSFKHLPIVRTRGDEVGKS